MAIFKKSNWKYQEHKHYYGSETGSRISGGCEGEIHKETD